MAETKKRILPDQNLPGALFGNIQDRISPKIGFCNLFVAILNFLC